MLDNAIFVFGANQLGIHGKAAALHAAKFYGAEKGVGEGLTGYVYAIPTKSTPNASLRLEQVKYHVDKFLEFAGAHQDKIFQVTRIGCGLAGFSDEQIYQARHKTSSVHGGDASTPAIEQNRGTHGVRLSSEHHQMSAAGTNLTQPLKAA